MKPSWVDKRDPVQHPIRFLAGLWQEKIKENFGIQQQLTPKELGQLKCLRKYLKDLTIDVVKWMLDPVNWWHFCQRAKVEHKLKFVPDRPEVGFLLQYRGHAVEIMNASTAKAELSAR
jgi:hypothetical protein